MKFKIVVVIFFIANRIYCQDIHFTQAMSNPMIINPASTGVFNGWERASLSHKNQWVNTGTKFFTTAVAADMNFFKPKRGNRAHMGFGMLFYNDIGGDSKFGTKQFLFNLSGVVPLQEMHQLSAGLQFGLGQRTGDLSSLIFSNQFNGEELDEELNSMEFNNLVSFMYPDMGAGVMYQYGTHKIGLIRDNQTFLKIGMSCFHINKPKLNYRVGYSERLYRKFTLHTSFIKDFAGSLVGLEAFFNQFFQGPHRESLYGAKFRYRLMSGSKTTGFKRDAYLILGFSHRIGDMIGPLLNFQIHGFNFGMSYDVTISKLGNYARSGGLEFSLVYTNMDFALFKRRR